MGTVAKGLSYKRNSYCWVSLLSATGHYFRLKQTLLGHTLPHMRDLGVSKCVLPMCQRDSFVNGMDFPQLSQVVHHPLQTQTHRQEATLLYCKEQVLPEVTPDWIVLCVPSISAVFILELVKIMNFLSFAASNLVQTILLSGRFFSNPWHHIDIVQLYPTF